MELLCRAIHCGLVEQVRAWTFATCGLFARQRHLSARLLAHLQLEFESDVPSAESPTLEQLQAVWIRGREIPIESLFSCCRVREPSSHAGACPIAPADVGAEAEAGLSDASPSARAWMGRLRSSSRPRATRSAAGTSAGAPEASAASSSDGASRPPQPCRALQRGNLVVLTSLQRLPSRRRPLPLAVPSPATMNDQ